MKKTVTKNVTDVRKQTQKIADNLNDQFEKTQDVSIAREAIAAYRVTVSAAKVQLLYKKVTGKPVKIDFFEE